MIRIRDISLPPQQDMSQLVFAAARQLRIDHTQIKRLDIKKRSVDARKKNDVRLIYTVDVLVKGREDKILKMAHNPKASIAQDSFYEPPKPEHLPAQRPVVVGFGPAGMFCALVLARAGCKPIVLERGQDAKTRQTLVQRFWETGALDPSATCSSEKAARAHFPTVSSTPASTIPETTGSWSNLQTQALARRFYLMQSRTSERTYW